jgi:hypothetical protein
MDANLKGTLPMLSLRSYQKKKFQPKQLTEDSGNFICGISAAAMHVNLYHAENELFTTSLYELDRVIELRLRLENDEQVEP